MTSLSYRSCCAVFQQLEIDYTIGMPHPVAALDLREAPIIRMCAALTVSSQPHLWSTMANTSVALPIYSFRRTTACVRLAPILLVKPAG